MALKFPLLPETSMSGRRVPRLPRRIAYRVRRATRAQPLAWMRDWRRLRHLRPLAFLGFLGPGLIAANAGNDAGGIATYSTVGAQYGYGLLWMMVLITVSLAVVQEMCARMGAATGKGLSDLIRERFGVRGAIFAMTTLLVANTLTTISEFFGVAAAMELFGIPKYVSVPVAAVAVWYLVTQGSYRRVEKIFLAMTFAFFAYPIAAVLAHPDWGQVTRNLVVPSFHWQSTYLLLFVGTVGTTITPYMQLYIQSSVAEKGVKMDRYGPEKADAYVGTLFGNFISAFIIIACAATIFVASGGRGVVINTADQAARALAPLLGSYAPILFGIGLLGASLLAAAVLPLSTAYSICESFGFEHGVSRSFREAPVFLGLFTGMLALGALIALIPGLPLIQLLVIVQVINGVLLPILLVFILLLVNDRRVMGKYVNGPVNNVIAWGTTVMMIALSTVMIASIVLPALGVPFLQ
ncbi:MAG TPA: Nramp family divalent metal transporter [Ktedonobacterales bacterium]|nr:Nramp family divalent metal transporter [Ktedonobacterales bacterium]